MTTKDVKFHHKILNDCWENRKCFRAYHKCL